MDASQHDTQIKITIAIKIHASLGERECAVLDRVVRDGDMLPAERVI